MDNGINYLFDEDEPLKVVNKLPYNPLKDTAVYDSVAESPWLQYSENKTITSAGR